jgi:hypothetical protein
MSFFGDSTWEYHVVVVSQPPENYLNYPPEVLSPLGVYCHAYVFRFNKDNYLESQEGDGGIYGYFSYGDNYSDSMVWEWSCIIREDSLSGRLYIGPHIICDMSLSEGDTFYLYGQYAMKVDSVQYVSGRKTISLSLLNHQDDYFFGTMYANQHADYIFPIRFIEGVGPTYGFATGDFYLSPPPLSQHGEPYLPLLLCLHKDDSLVYMADDRLGCVQTCVGVSDLPQRILNLYPNPATQYVVLDLSMEEEMDGMVMITDMLGRQCFQQKANGTNVRISVADLPTGMYFLTYTDGKYKTTRKFMKK